MSNPLPPSQGEETVVHHPEVKGHQSRASTKRNAIRDGQRGHTNTATINIDQNAINIALEEFDEYGAELGQDARVWKTYVKEADKFDTEQVEGWNRSLDVTLIFAALFTAICTAFVIESAKSLKEDTAEAAARRLDQIASILLLVANVNNPPPLNSTEITAPIAPEPFSPRRVDMCVNALWFFSLILSAAVALLAMLAKEWCYLFMSGRIGDPWSQTKRRQQRWKGIQKWKMERVIILLPSFIHLSFLSFAIGLCIYLGDLNWCVAIPALIVTFGSVVVYVASTISPFLNLSDTICPYSTSISRQVQRIKRGTKSAEHEFGQTVRIAVEALVWLIEASEDPKSTDIALQAIAGADPNEADRQLLKDCGADTMISRRLIGLDSYSNNFEQVSDLYTRAQLFFQPSTVASGQQRGTPPLAEEKVDTNTNQGVRQSSAGGLQKNLNRELQRKIRDLRDMINKQITAYVTSSDHVYLSTPDSTRALRIGSTAASHCFRSLEHGIQFQTQELHDSAIELLESYRKNDAHLDAMEIRCLVIGIAMLLSSLLIKCPPAIGADYIMRLLRIASRAEGRQQQLRLEYLGLPLVVYALSRHDYPGWTQPPPLSPMSREERAIEVIAYYVSHPSELSNTSSIMVNLGLLELLSDPGEYQLKGDDIVDISGSVAGGAGGVGVHTLPANIDAYLFSRTLESIARMIAGKPLGVSNEIPVAIACLTVLDRTYVQKTHSTTSGPLAQVYAFVIECVLAVPALDPEAYGRNVALDLLQKFHDCLASTQDFMLIAESLSEREILAKLKEASDMKAASNDTNFVTKLFGAGQVWFLIDLATKSGTIDHEGRRRCLSSLGGDESLSDSPDLVIRRLEEQRNALAEQYREMWDNDTTIRRHSYLERLFNSLPPVGTEQSNPLADTQQSSSA